MADVTSVTTFTPVAPELNYRFVVAECAATVDAADTFTITLSDYGATKILGVIGWDHTTTDSVVVQVQPTTSVTAGVLTVTVGAGGDNRKRVFWIILA